jgi:hypothetical protein
VSSKILIAVIAFAAGGAAVYGYQTVTSNLSPPSQRDSEMRLSEMEKQVAVLAKELERVRMAQHNTDSDTDALSSRVSVLDELFSRLDEKKANSGLLGSDMGGREPAPARTNEGRSQSSVPGQRRITGEELAEALREMPEDGREMIRRAIHEELQRIRDESVYKMETKEELEKKAQASIKSFTNALSLTPVQVDQFTDIVARQVEKILEIHRVVKENGDLEYARKEREKTRTEAEREVVDMLTPEQMDKLRELDPNGFGKRYPRGF